MALRNVRLRNYSRTAFHQITTVVIRVNLGTTNLLKSVTTNTSIIRHNNIPTDYVYN